MRSRLEDMPRALPLGIVATDNLTHAGKRVVLWRGSNERLPDCEASDESAGGLASGSVASSSSMMTFGVGGDEESGASSAFDRDSVDSFVGQFYSEYCSSDTALVVLSNSTLERMTKINKEYGVYGESDERLLGLAGDASATAAVSAAAGDDGEEKKEDGAGGDVPSTQSSVVAHVCDYKSCKKPIIKLNEFVETLSDL